LVNRLPCTLCVNLPSIDSPVDYISIFYLQIAFFITYQFSIHRLSCSLCVSLPSLDCTVRYLSVFNPQRVLLNMYHPSIHRMYFSLFITLQSTDSPVHYVSFFPQFDPIKPELLISPLNKPKLINKHHSVSKSARICPYFCLET
jgi:hypothetical protein